jgi:hypothetical protein
MGAIAGPTYTAPARVKAILAELERVAAEYVENQKQYQAAHVHFQAARERFASIKRIASEMLAFNDWNDWQAGHSNVRYAAMTIGEAIREALQVRAFDAAAAVAPSPESAREHFSPGMTLEQIAEALEKGGFEFRTSTPKREVNAALIKLDGITKNAKTEEYEIGDAAEILQMFLAELETG